VPAAGGRVGARGAADVAVRALVAALRLAAAAAAEDLRDAARDRRAEEARDDRGVARQAVERRRGRMIVGETLVVHVAARAPRAARAAAAVAPGAILLAREPVLDPVRLAQRAHLVERAPADALELGAAG